MPNRYLVPDEQDVILKSPEFTLRQLSYFLAVAQYQSIQRAADALHISPPAISAAIAHLESALRVTLFKRRHARGLILTEDGTTFAVRCRNILQSAWDLTSSGGIHGQIRVGCLKTFSPFVIPQLVAQVREHLPGARLNWTEGYTEYLLEALQNGTLDLAVLYDFEIPSGIETISVRPAPLQVVLPAGHPLSRRSSLRAADLQGESLVLLDLPRTREYMLMAFGNASSMPRISQTVTSLEMLMGMVAAGEGFSLLNFCPPSGLFGSGDLVSRAFESSIRQPDIVIAHSFRYQLPQVASAIIEQLTKLINDIEIQTF
ncbi:LysR-family transcriptional regulator [Marinobacterium lacunae]|uniref:LysR-family transcriptional regulator n=1 Tax=Marinobacterium lacunae TaxID=1232683 RepID=A0A081G0Z3_9GAMM|nr:LysR family transcriptional regulator [Marinobacterium lacunae]KEA64448.1 LysR-family transcriptional regulator [Marinobacterium lacunae]